MMMTPIRPARYAQRQNAGYSSAPGAETRAPETRSLAMVYPVFQKFEDLYEPGDALYAGTLFKALEKPFHKGFRI